MDNNHTLITDITTVLKSKGLSDHEADETVRQIIAEVQLEVVEDLLGALTSEQAEMIETLIEEEADTDTIAEKLDLDADTIITLEKQKLAFVLQSIASTLNSA